MSQLPQNNEVFDYNPEYAKPHRGSGSMQSGTDDQPLPASEFSSSVWKMGPGEKAANLSLIFGVFGMLALALAFWWVSHGFGYRYANNHCCAITEPLGSLASTSGKTAR